MFYMGMFYNPITKRRMGTLHKMHNLAKMMNIKRTNICANGTGFIKVHVITTATKKHEPSLAFSPVAESLIKWMSCVFFSKSKAINDTEHAWAPITLVWLLCFAPSALSMTTQAQRWAQNSSSQFIISYISLSFSPHSSSFVSPHPRGQRSFSSRYQPHQDNKQT